MKLLGDIRTTAPLTRQTQYLALAIGQWIAFTPGVAGELMVYDAASRVHLSDGIGEAAGR